MTGLLKIVGPQLSSNSTNIPSTIPTNAKAGSNADSGNGTFSGFGNSTTGGATALYIYNANTTTAAAIVVSNSGVNTGTITIPANSSILLSKYPYDLIANVSITGVLFTPVAFRSV